MPDISGKESRTVQSQTESAAEEDESQDEGLEVNESELPPEAEVSAIELGVNDAPLQPQSTCKKHVTLRGMSEHSIIVYFVTFVCLKIYRVVRHSMTAALLTAYDRTAVLFRSTWLYGLFFSEKSLRHINAVKVRIRRITTDATIPKYLRRIISSLLIIRTRVYGFILLFFGSTTLIVHYSINSVYKIFSYDLYAPITGVAVCAVSFFLIFSGGTLSQSVYESKLLNALIFDLLGVKRTSADTESSLELSVSGACIFGAIMGMLTLVFPARLILMGILALIYSAVVIKSPEAGIISIIVLAPVAPLSVMVIAIAFLTISYLFKALCGKRTLRLEFMDIFVGLFMLCALSGETVSFGGTGNPVSALCFISVYFTSVSILRSDVWFKRAIRSVTLCVSVMAVLSVIFYFLVRYAGADVFAGVNIAVSRKILSQVLLYTGFIMLAVFLKAESNNGKFGMLIICLCIAVYLTLSLPATALIAAAVSLAIFALLYNGRNIVLIVLAVLAQTFLKVFGGGLTSDSLLTDKNVLSRWNAIIRMLSRFGFTGIGSSDNAAEVIYSSFFVGSADGMSYEENLILGLALSLGYIGAAMFVISFFFILQSSFSYGRGCTDKSDWYRVIGYAGMCGLIAAFIYGIVADIWSDSRMMLIYWLLAGITVSCNRCSKDNSSGERDGISDLDPSL